MSKNDKDDKEFENIDSKLERMKTDLDLLSQILSLQLETETVESNIKKRKWVMRVKLEFCFLFF